MSSAFGIDHGEISKAALPRSTTARKLGQLVRITSTKAKASGTKAVNTPLSISGLGRATGRGTARTGRGVTAVGEAMQRNGGLTGAAVVGGAAGAGGYSYNRALNKKPAKKTKIPKAM